MTIVAENLCRSTKRTRIVDDVSISLDPGEIGTLLGPSGSGKSSLLRLIMGLDRLDSGSLILDGRQVAGDGLHMPADQRGAAMVFQEFTLFPHLSVQDNITFGPQAPGDAADPGAVTEMLEIAHLTGRSIANLSGGEQQRVALARALVTGPRLLLLDEAFSNVDNMLKERLYERLLDHLRKMGTTVILATHDHAEAFFFSDRIFVMKDGRLIDANKPEGIYQKPRNLWVADFFGACNVMTADDLAAMGHAVTPGQYLVRPEMLHLCAEGGAAADVLETGFFGFYRELRIKTPDGKVVRVRTQDPVDAKPGDKVHVALRAGIVPHRLAEAEGTP